jgi:lysophospholipase L1-like esterase
MKKLLVVAAAVLFALPSMGQAAYNYRSRSMYELLPVKSHNIVMLGDSLTDECEWAELFGDRNILNRGISGDCAIWLGDRLDPIIAGQPRKLFLLIGFNDLHDNVPIEKIVRSIDGVVERLQKETPQTEIYVESVLPVDITYPFFADKQDRNCQITELNRRIMAVAEKRGVPYIDVHSVLKDETGNLRKDFSNDGLHLMSAGYMAWKNLLEPYINVSSMN